MNRPGKSSVATPTIARRGLALLCALLAVGCSDDPSQPRDPDDPGTGTVLEPPPDGQGVQYLMTSEIPAGSEVERCQYVTAPAEGLFVNRDEVRYSVGSHHFLLYETGYPSIPQEGVFDCSDGPTDGVPVRRLVGGSQNFDGDSLLTFPADVALSVRPGAVLLMNAHYINTTPDPLPVEVRINLWSIPEADVAHEGDVLFWYNSFIKVPALGSSKARMRCEVPQDITVTSLQSHMHARGVGYEAVTDDGTTLYANEHWENVPVSVFDEGLDITAGTVVDYHCAYENSEPHDVFQGPRSTDEMCMLIGSYYPAVPELGECEWEEWVGDGTATCAETMACVQAGLSMDDDDEASPHIQGCVVDSDPAVSREMTAAVDCLIDDDDAGSAECSDAINACAAI